MPFCAAELCCSSEMCRNVCSSLIFFLLKVPAELAIHDRYFIVGSVVFYCAHLIILPYYGYDV